MDYGDRINASVIFPLLRIQLKMMKDCGIFITAAITYMVLAAMETFSFTMTTMALLQGLVG